MLMPSEGLSQTIVNQFPEKFSGQSMPDGMPKTGMGGTADQDGMPYEWFLLGGLLVAAIGGTFALRKILGLSLLLTVCQTEEATPEQESTVDKQEASSEEASSSTQKTNLTLSESQLTASKLIKDERQGIVPTRLKIPAINVDAPINPAGLTEDGDMAVPNDIISTGWFERGYMPGEPGNSVIAGHVDGKNGPAVFYDIGKLKNGDEVS
jgi:sortase (surface protein transpeptidase)